MEEIWRKHPDINENYEFSNFGRFRRADTKYLLKQTVDKGKHGGYAVSFLKNRNNVRKRVRIHRLVAQLFVHNPKPDLYNEVNHKDGVKINNHYTNLEWIDSLGNNRHAIDTGLRKRGPKQKLTESDVREIRQIINDTDISLVDVGKQYKITTQNILFCITYNTWETFEPDKKFTYKVNNLKGKEFIDYINERGYRLKGPKKINYDLIRLNNIKSELATAFVNGVTLMKLAEIHDTSYSLIYRIIKDIDLPKPIIEENEFFVKINSSIQISNFGRVTINNIITTVSNNTLIKFLGKAFIPNPNNYKKLRLKDINAAVDINNIEWFSKTELNKNIKIENQNENSILFHNQIVFDYMNTSTHKDEIIRKYNISLKNLNDILKTCDISKSVRRKVLVGKCKLCGETSPDKFKYGRKSKCKTCITKLSNKYEKKGPKIPLCKYCGESNVLKFTKNVKSKCKACEKKFYYKYVKRGPRIPLCKVCNETSPDKFKYGRKSLCIKCVKIKT